MPRAVEVGQAHPGPGSRPVLDPPAGPVLGERQLPARPLGVPAGRLDTAARALLDRLLAVYLDRLVPQLAQTEYARLRDGDLYFAWAGPAEPGHGHYYRIQGPDLLVEYDNTQNGANHAHTVLRRPLSDFGDDVLAAHHAHERS